MTAYTTSYAGNVQIGTGDNINPPDEANALVQQSVPIVINAAGTGSTFFRLPANCRISDIWFDIAGPAGALATGGTWALYFSLDNVTYPQYAAGTVPTTATRFTLGAPTGTPFTNTLNTGNNIFWRFDVAAVAPVTATGQFVIRYHLLTP